METNNNKLAILWTCADRDVALKMVFMYAKNAKLKGWWKEVTLIVWGPSANLLSQDAELQHYVKALKEAGVELFACKACADSYGVTQNLELMEIKVIYMGKPFTDFIKEDVKILTF